MLCLMSYDYLFCATCGQRRTGHRRRCSVCDSLLRRPQLRRTATVHQLQPLVRSEPPKHVRVAA
jgi:hypothetical protein